MNSRESVLYMNTNRASTGVGDASHPGSRAHRSAEADHLADLLSRAARGQEYAFSELYDLTSARIHGVILRVLRSADHAVEVTQEVYIEIWKQASRYNPEKGSP